MPPGQILLPRVSSWGQWRGLIDTRRHRTPVSRLMKEVHACSVQSQGGDHPLGRQSTEMLVPHSRPPNNIHVEFSQFTSPNKNFSSVSSAVQPGCWTPDVLSPAWSTVGQGCRGRLQCTGSPPGPGATPGWLVTWWARLRPASCKLPHQGCTLSPVAIGAQVHVLFPQASHPRGGG